MTGKLFKTLVIPGMIGLCLGIMLLTGLQNISAEDKAPAAKPAVTATAAPAASTPSAAPAAKQDSVADKKAADAKAPADAKAEKSADAKMDAKAPADAKAETKADAKAAAPVVAAQPSDADKDQTKANTLKSGFFVLKVILVFVICFLIGTYFSKSIRMPERQSAYTLILFCTIGATFATWYGISHHRLNLGIDLRGGSILTYEVKPNADAKGAEIKTEKKSAGGREGITNQQMGELKSAIMKRINPSGVREISIQELGNNTEIKITIPEADEAEVKRITNLINSTGQLKFRILASRSAPEEQEMIQLAEKSQDWTIVLPKPAGKNGMILGGTWVPVDPTQHDIIGRSDIVYRQTKKAKDATKPAADQYVYDVLLLDLTADYRVDGSHMASVREGMGETGDPQVYFNMKAEGAKPLQKVTNHYKEGADRRSGRPLGIVMNDSLYSAPSINDTIAKSGVITFGRDLTADSRSRIQKEVRDLIQVMNAGVLPAKLSDEPKSRMDTGPTLGADTIEKGKNSIIWGGSLVLVFMIAYYGFGGVVASFAVILNLLLIMTFMLGLRAAFTLPGLAGLALTVGMAVDANVLIFERIKEEINNGATLHMAIRNGYQRAFSAILDSNVTTMLTAVILYAVGTEQIKGFAVTLFLGVGFSLFTATYVCRVIFETCERKGWIGRRCVYPILPGLKPIGRTNIDFVKKQKVAFIIANILVLIGIIGVIARGKGIFDIDFVGGVEVQTIFKQPQAIGDIRSKLKELPDLSVSNLSLSKDQFGNPVKENTFFSICTSCDPHVEADVYRVQVEDKLKAAFGEVLQFHSFQYKIVGTEDVPVAGSVDKKTNKQILLEVTLNPPMTGVVIKDDIEKSKDAVLAGRKASKSDIENLTVEVLSDTPDDAAATWKLHLNTTDEKLVHEFMDKVVKDINERPVFEASNTVGSSVAGYARTQGLFAIFASLVCIIFYIWGRFSKVVFGISSVIALVYNVLIALGALAVSSWLAPLPGMDVLGVSEFKIGLPTVAAFLTIIGYSLNDTIVLFDRIREIYVRGTNMTVELVNKSINQTLSRTLLTSITTLFVAAVLYFFGGASIHTFAFTMCLGIIFGTLGTIFVASASLLWFMKSTANTEKK